MAARTLEITFIGNPKPLQDALGKVEESSGTLHGKISGLAGAFTNVASVAGGFLLGNAISKGPAALMGLSDVARDLELQMKKASTVFGDQLPIVEKWAAGSAAAMGLSKNQAVNLASGLQDLLVPMGFTREAGTAMTTSTLNLAGALAEWTGGQKGAAEVSDILTKAYLGETDGLKALGIAISADEVNSRLAAQGKDKLTGSALAQAKALEIQKLIMEKSTDAQKAFAEGSGSAARKQAEMQAKIQEAKEALANGLAPAIAAVTTLAATSLVPAIDLAGQVMAKLRDVAVELVSAGWDKLSGPLATIAGLAWDALKDGAGALKDLAMAGGELAAVAWDAIAGSLADIAGNIERVALAKWQDISPQVNSFGAALAGVNWQTFLDGFNRVKAAVQPAIDALHPFVEKTLADLKEQFGKVAESLKPLADALGELLDALAPLEPVIKPLAQAMGVLIVANIAAMLVAIDLAVKALGTTLKLAIDAVVLAVRGLAAVLTVVVPPLAAVFVGMWDGSKAAFDSLRGAIQGIGDLTTTVFGAIGGTVKAGLNSVIRAVNKMIDALNSLQIHIPAVGVGPLKTPAFDWNGLGLGHIPELAAGGIVMRPTLAVIGESGPEAVIPLSRGRAAVGGGVTIQIMGNVYGVDDLVRVIDLSLKRAGRAGIA